MRRREHHLYAKRLCAAGLGEKSIAANMRRLQDVDYFPGFGFMARREVFEKLNFLDESFYGYGHEDTDFCLRAAQLGYRVVYVPKAVMWHRGSATIGDYSPRKKYLEAVNSVYFVRKYGKLTIACKYAFFAGFGLIYAPRGAIIPWQPCRLFLPKARGIWDGLRKPMHEADDGPSVNDHHPYLGRLKTEDVHGHFYGSI